MARLKVIGVGFGRTGTLSLKLALERLGFGPCYHMVEVLDRPGRSADWAAVARGERVDWDRVFEGYQSTVDWPGAAVWRELVDRYPDAKVILTVRDPNRWYDSAASTIFRMMMPRSPIATLIASIASPRGRAFRDFTAMTRGLILQRTFGGRVDDRERAIAVFEQHTRDVEEHVQAGRLLVMDVASGWQPLCSFLDVPVPDEPFPRVNDRAEFMGRIHDRMMRALAVRGAVAAAVLAVAVTGAVAVRRRGR